MLNQYSGYFDTTTVMVVLGGTLTVVVGILLRLARVPLLRLPDWLITTVLGATLGSGISLAAMHSLGYHWTRQAESSAAGDRTVQAVSALAGMGAGLPGMSGGMGGAMAGMGGMGGGMGGAMGGSNAARARRNLTDFVWKLERATQGIRLEFDTNQSQEFAAQLTGMAAEEAMSDQEAATHLEALEAILTPEQKEVLESFARPVRRRAGFGAGGGLAGLMAPAGVSSGAAGSAGQPENANPFQEEEQKNTLLQLIDRVKGPAN